MKSPGIFPETRQRSRLGKKPRRKRRRLNQQPLLSNEKEDLVKEPKKVKEVTRLQKQEYMSLEEMLRDLP